MTYQVADGHDVALISLNPVIPQPTSEGIKATRRSYAASGGVYDEGRYVELEFSVLGSETSYQTLLSEFGVNTVLTNDVTVYVRDEKYTWVRMNGTAVRPEVGQDVQWRRYFPRNITILIKDLVESS